MRLELSAADVAFQNEVRAFLEQHLTPELRSAAQRQAGVFAHADLNRRWQKVLFDKGWIAPGWPAQHGGAAFSPVQRFIFESELAAAGAPVLPAMGIQMCGPVLMEYGAPAQKAFFLPRILSGEHYWCQGYSEPGSGSDLASLQTRAVRNGEDYVVDGSKIWTTHAHFANWIFLLVRTSSEGKPQSGITFLLAPLDTPGITVAPIISISGEHEVNQVFFDGARIPIANRVGEENHGWTVAKYLLQFERGGFYAARMRRALRELKDMAMAERGSENAAVNQQAFRRRVAELEVAVEAAAAAELRMVSQMSSGQAVPDATASMLKLQGTETLQEISELGLEILGGYAFIDQTASLSDRSNSVIGPPHALTPTARYLNLRAASIFGGTSEVQRNIIARAALGL